MSEDYIQFGEVWEKELKKLPKDYLIGLLREALAGTKDRKIVEIRTMKDAQNQVEGIINDFESGIATKEETMSLMGEYTNRTMAIFWERAKEMIKENPTILEK